jgi:uncharacterized protein YlaN (UPF0358 family)
MYDFFLGILQTTSYRNAGKGFIHKNQSSWTLLQTLCKRELHAPGCPLYNVNLDTSIRREVNFAVSLSPQISISTSRASMKLIDFRARISTKCANENTRIEELNLQSDQVKEFVQADENVPQKRSAKIHDFCLGIPFGKFEYHQCKTVWCA